LAQIFLKNLLILNSCLFLLFLFIFSDGRLKIYVDFQSYIFNKITFICHINSSIIMVRDDEERVC
ncbi:TPA: hypothetical protein ACIN11_001993, partial [Streptococcus agalactiae]